MEGIEDLLAEEPAEDAEEPTETVLPDPAEIDPAEDDDSPLFEPGELEALIASSPLGKQNAAPVEPFSVEGITVSTPAEEVAARVAVPEDSQAYETVKEDLGLRIEELRAQRDSTPANRPLLRQKLERDFTRLSGERAAVAMAYDLQQEQRAVALYEQSEQAKREKASIAHMRGVLVAEAEAMAAKDEADRQARARTLAKSLVRPGGIYRKLP